jgi:hypothetical protein
MPDHTRKRLTWAYATMALFFIVPRCVIPKKAASSLVSRFTACSTVEKGFASRSARLLTSTDDIVARRIDGQRTQAGMGDTGSALHTQSNRKRFVHYLGCLCIFRRVINHPATIERPLRGLEPA